MTPWYFKLYLLLWKNYILQIRHKVQTIAEILVPLGFVLILVSIRGAVNVENKNSTIFDAFPIMIKPVELSKGPAWKTAVPFLKHVFYTPNNNLTTELMEKVNYEHFSKYFNENDGLYNYTFTGFNSEGELLDYYKDHISRLPLPFYDTTPDKLLAMDPLLAAVVFPSTFGSDGQIPDKIEYTLRFPLTQRNKTHKEIEDGQKSIWTTEATYPYFQIIGPRQINETEGGVPGYFREGFLYLQHAIDRVLINSKNEEFDMDQYDINLRRYPYPPYLEDNFIFAIQNTLPLLMMLGFIYPVINITKSIVIEKEKRLKESMKMMGLPNYLHWLSWFIKSFLFLFISVVLMSILISIKIYDGTGVITYTNGFIIFLFFFVFLFSVITFSFMVSSMFSRANSAATAAGVLWFVTYFPYTFMEPYYYDMTKTTKLLSSLICNTGMAFGCHVISKFEGTGAGIQWDTLGSTSSPDDNLDMLSLIAVLAFDALLYFLIAIYIEGVWPGEFGVPLPWYFPFTGWYWTGNPRNVKSKVQVINPNGNNNNATYFETEPSGTNAGIRIKGLTKTFGKKVAVNNLDLNMYENQITALLGHNGAGKSTTMGMLTGLFPPSGGTAYVNGFDIRTDIKSVRDSLGLCPQHDVLFDEMTVEEHLKFFTQMKGFPSSKVQTEVDRMLKALNLENKRNAQSQTLSGGMKRKLSVGIALCGGSKVVLLDEPTSGMDPGARRSTWDLMKSEKRNRTILLSTHFMDEADLLGDRIAILANGIIQCCGGSLFLKKRFGGGYHLIIVKGPGCNVQVITNILAKKIPDIRIGADVGAELSYSLPDEKSHLFADMFGELERRKTELGISSYGASITTMEEVFMRVGKMAEEKDVNHEFDHDAKVLKLHMENGDRNNSKDKLSEIETVRNSGVKLLMQQMWAMIVKKGLYAVRNRILLISQILIPIFFLTIGLILVKTMPTGQNPSVLDVNLDKLEKYGGIETTMMCNGNPDPICQSFRYLMEPISLVENVTGQSLNFVDFMLKKADDLKVNLNFRYLIGLDLDLNKTVNGSVKVTTFFNNQPLHIAPIALNIITNSILQAHESMRNISIIVKNQPLPETTADIVEKAGGFESSAFQVGFNIAFGMSFLAASFVVFLIRERVNRAKHLQFVSGVRYAIFWGGNLIFDSINYLIPCILLIIIIIGFQLDDVKSAAVIGHIFALFIFYGLGVIPLMYLFSFMFSIPSSGYTRMLMLNVFTGIATILATTVLSIPELDLVHIADALEWVFMIFPNYNLGIGVINLSTNEQLRRSCPLLFGEVPRDIFCRIEADHRCCEQFPQDWFGWNKAGIGRNILYLSVVGIISTLLIFGIEAHIFPTIKCCWSKGGCCNCSSNGKPKKNKLGAKRPSSVKISEDDDVDMENKRIRRTNLTQLYKTDNLVIRDLSKYYDSFLAVDKLSLGVQRGECFGLLGVNGAGKTTTFKMLTGDVSPSSGDAFIYGNSVTNDLKKCQRNVGYCPQFDAIIEELTGRETIRLFARLRGVPENTIDRLVSKLAADLLFTQHIDKRVGAYSGGNKRKLSTALALIGNPPLVFLDEPTTGMDPVARRHLWNAISVIRESGTSLILTSHSMEECEALCSRLAIMVNGKFRCLGPPQHLKSKFGQGYTLIAQMPTTEDYAEEIDGVIPKWEIELEPLRQFIESRFPGCILKDIHPGFVHYHVTDTRVGWGALFSQMELAKAQFGLEAYSVGQTTLEQVFLNFTKTQIVD